ncbi:MAG: adenosine deaminase [bacterium]|nr:adenosine deaminase [bacterium]MBU1918133.1 adenosine deaminase [bacterium]
MRNEFIKTELHCHLEGAIPAKWLYKMGRQHSLIDNNYSYETFYQDMVLTAPSESLKKVLSYFDLIGKFLANRDILFEATKEVCRFENIAGIKNLELRYAPLMLKKYAGLSFDESHAVISEAVNWAQEKLKMKVGLIAIGERNYSFDEIVSVLEWAINNESKLIGVDLANQEFDFEPKKYANIFNKVHQTDLGITIHCSESGFPQQVVETIKYIKPNRIGHGIAIVNSPDIMQLVREREITLELCPTSNWITRCVSDPSKHPLKTFLDRGLRVTLNTDDPGLFDISMPKEIEFCKKYLNLEQKDFALLNIYATDASFLDLD